MNIPAGHSWHLSIPEAMALQARLASRVSCDGSPPRVRYIAGIDVSVSRAENTGTAAVVVLDYPGLNMVEAQTARDTIDFPYVPGLLSFRELPLVLKAWQRLTTRPDLVLVDGQGRAHPRRFGIACHLGMWLDTPSIGCAKSRLCGTSAMPDEEAGSSSELVDSGETIGAVLRSRANTRPLFVSIGHKISLPQAIHWVLACCRGYRLPEPLRLAHQVAGGRIKNAPEQILAGRPE